MKKIVASFVLAFGGMFATATAVAHADDVEITNLKYATEEGCEAEAPNVSLTHHDSHYPYWYCEAGDDGFWHIWNSTHP
ncbi:hypothetical protein [Mycobacterium sp.]|uniref:hypothetical protein n=1 Tax=Mycobacterium sp. TaxID=1785 RepID=UPI003C77F199